MRLLLVAPDTDLPKQSAEVAAIANLAGMDVYQMQGTISRQGLRHQLQGSDYEILWIAGHGTKGYIALSAGEMMDYPTLSGLVRSSRIKYVYLNTCTGVEIAQDIAQESGADVVCMLAEVPDLAAYEWATDFGKQLEAGKSFREAYEEVRRIAGRDYKYVVGSEMDTHVNPSKPEKSLVTNGGLDISGRLRMLEQLVYGDDRLGLKPISAQIAYLVGRMAQLEPSMDALTRENISLREEIMSLKASLSGLHRERLELEKKLAALSTQLSEYTLLAPRPKQNWYIEYAGPILGLAAVLLMLYIVFQIQRVVS